jgi:hypothetical protein
MRRMVSISRGPAFQIGCPVRTPNGRPVDGCIPWAADRPLCGRCSWRRLVLGGLVGDRAIAVPTISPNGRRVAIEDRGEGRHRWLAIFASGAAPAEHALANQVAVTRRGRLTGRAGREVSLEEGLR